MTKKQFRKLTKSKKREAMLNFSQEVARAGLESRVRRLRPPIEGECFDYCPGVPLINHKAKYAAVVVSMKEGQQAMEVLRRSGYEVLRLSFKTHIGEMKGHLIQFGFRMWRRIQRGEVSV